MILRCCLLLLVFFASTAVQAVELSSSSSLIDHVKVKKLKVVATIRPIHSLLSFIMQGTTEPLLLLDQTQSAHNYSLRPSQRSTLAHADMVFWVGESLESFMPRVLNSLPKKVPVIELMDSKNLVLLKPRSDDEATAHQHNHGHGSLDPHIWLSIDNALILATEMSLALTLLDPANKAIYNNNLRKLTLRLATKKRKIRKIFSHANFKFMVYHDAFQYFEKQINVKPLIAISTNEEQAPGVRHLSQVNKLIVSNKVNCVIYNTISLPAIARNLINNIRQIHIDPLAQSFKTGPELYFNLLDSLANGYQQCQLSTE